MKRNIFAVAIAVLCLSACGSKDDPEVIVTPGGDKKEEEPKEEVNTVSYTPAWTEEGMENALYMTDGDLQIGVDMDRGGAVFHVSSVKDKRNLLNHYDEGRFVQQSYYGDADGSLWNKTPWNWNPVQGGSWDGKKATVLSSSASGGTIKVTTRPMHWATGESLSDCSMAEEISFEKGCIRIQYTFTYSSAAAKSFKARHQEMPAVFCDAALTRFAYYAGKQPWTKAALTYVVPKNLSDGATNQYVERTEDWAAYVDESGYGIGVYTPGTTNTTYYTAGHGNTGPKAAACSYFAPIRTLAITKGLVLKYDVYIAIGQIDSIRDKFYSIRSGK